MTTTWTAFYQPEKAIYAIPFLTKSGYAIKTDGTLEAYDETHLASYAVVYAGVGPHYSVSVPSTLPQDALIDVAIYEQTGEAPDASDSLRGAFSGTFDGQWADAAGDTVWCVAEPLSTEGTLNIFRGSSYLLADETAVTFPFSGAVPDLTGCTAKLIAHSLTPRCEVLSIAGIITSPTSNPTITFDIAGQTTAALSSHLDYEYVVLATFANGDVAPPLQVGEMLVAE